MSDNPIRALTQTAVQNQRFTFEVRYRAIESTVVGRINKEIEERVEQTDYASRNRLVDDIRKLEKGLPSVQEYLQANKNLKSQLEGVVDEVNALLETLGDDDAVTQEEVDAFNDRKGELVNKLKRLQELSHPDFVDTKEIGRIKDRFVDAIEALDPVVGSKTADNAGVTDTLFNLITDANISSTNSQNTINTVFAVENSIKTKSLEIQGKILEFDEITLKQQEFDIEEIKGKYSNVLKAISLSFEGNAALVESFDKLFQGQQRPEPGSIMNLFL